MFNYTKRCFDNFDYEEIDEMKLDFLHHICELFEISPNHISTTETAFKLDDGIMFIEVLKVCDAEHYNRLCASIGSSIIGTNSIFRPIIDITESEFNDLLNDLCLLYDTWADYKKYLGGK